MKLYHHMVALTTRIPAQSGPYESIAAIWCALVAACLSALMMSATGAEFMLDDAYIHLSYAKSIRLGDGLSYNPGDWETGFSSPLWVFVLSVWPIPLQPDTNP